MNPVIASPIASWLQRFALVVVASMLLASPAGALDLPNVPLSVQKSVAPLVMLVSAKDHRLFYEAYNDASDLDGDGLLEIRFKPSLTYLGLFQSAYCYTYDSAANRFNPDSVAVNGKCSNKWSGNFLNYVTTSRIDALRVVLYGGMRSVDTPTETVLRRAYIPQDAHAWAKEYTSAAVDGYKISDYTPLAAPLDSGKRHFFGNVTPNATTSCATLSNCSNINPWLSVVENSTTRVWFWASSDAPTLRDTHHQGMRRTNYTVQVSACTPGFRNGCKDYSSTSSKPIGLLQEYGESGAMHFGLLTGSYDNSMAGGRLRKIISSFADEVDPKTGQFTAAMGIVASYNALRIRDYNNTNISAEFGSYKGGWVTKRPPNAGEFPDWGNPVGEMMFEALRYFAGKGTPTSAFAQPETVDGEVGLPIATWNNPYASKDSSTAGPYCAKANMMVISEPNVSYDSDQVPGSAFSSGMADDIGDFNATTEANRISDNEPTVAGKHFIGQSGNNFDSAPTSKDVRSLSNIRGLAPDEPTKQGSYYAASVAAFGHRTDINPVSKVQNVNTVVLALPPTMPRFNIPLPNGRSVVVVPFAKSVKAAAAERQFSANKGDFQPTNQIVDFYVDSIVNSSDADRNAAVNQGRYQAKFRINFEDVEQGADHDMDVIVEYEIKVLSEDQLEILLRPVKQGGGMQHNIGYVISGTKTDGLYLEVQDEVKAIPVGYFLNTPAGMLPGGCDATPMPTACTTLPYLTGAGGDQTPPPEARRTFQTSTSAAATYLKDPLWYAAKWGGFTDRDGNGVPNLASEWDANGDGIPDNYLPVNNPTKLKDAMRAALENIASRNSSASNVALNSTSSATDAMVFQATFNSSRWSGDLTAYQIGANGLNAQPAWVASQQLGPWASRKLFYRASNQTAARWQGYTAMSEADQKLMSSAAISDWLRGDRTNEVTKLRERGNPLGDIIHSSPASDPVTKAVYVGANDGMLHAFNGQTGAELFAVAPRQAFTQMAKLADPAYSHSFLVDGEIALAPASDLTGNRTLLFALLGRGGRGLFALDVTTPSNFSESNFLWEFTEAEGATRMDDLGHMLGRPVVAKLNNGKLGLIVGNGYNSKSGRAVLYIFIIDKSGALIDTIAIDTKEGQDNGLAGPAAIDTNGDGTVDVVYAGDLKGNVWKFDLSDTKTTSWTSATSIFKAVDANGKAQPITAPMYAARKPADPSGKDIHAGRWFVFFGTGSYLSQTDPASVDVQSWYGLDTQESNITRHALRKRSILTSGAVNGYRVRTFSKAQDKDMDTVKGWYVDLTETGERIVGASKVITSPVPALLAASIFPVPSDPCIPGGRGYLNYIDPYTGASLSSSLLDVNGNGKSDDKLDNDVIGSVDPSIGMVTEPTILDLGARGRIIVTGGTGDPSKDSPTSAGTSGTKGNCTIDCEPDTIRTFGVPNPTGTTGATLPVKYKGRIAWREIIKN